MNTRTELIKKNVISITPEICLERARIITEAYKENESLPIIIKRAKALEKILAEMAIYIYSDELIVGNQASKPRAAPIFPEMGVNWIEKEIDKFSLRTHDKFLMTEECKQEFLFSIVPYWKGRTYEDRVSYLTKLMFSDQKWGDWDPTYNPLINNASRRKTGNGTMVVDYEKVIKEGLVAIIREAEAELNKLDVSKPDDFEKSLFLKSSIITYKAAIRFAMRFSKEANRLAKTEDRSWRRNELKKIAKICQHVPGNPARTFWEALQSFWFIHLILQIDHNGHAINLGRFDQTLYPSYKKDLAEGKITQNQAIELLEHLWIKCNEINLLREQAWTSYTSGYQMFMTVTLGGQLSDGSDATNELSYLCLEATGNLKLPMPTVVIACHSKMPEKFLDESCKTLIKHGGGIPSFFNGDVIIQTLMDEGVVLKDARNWAISGCAEPIVPAKSNSHAMGNCIINLAKLLEVTLNTGTELGSDIHMLTNNKDLTIFPFHSFDDLFNKFKNNIKICIRLATKLDAVTASSYAELVPQPFKSGLIKNRIKYGRDITKGGGPNYNKTIIGAQGTANVGNSLAAIKYLVFEKKIISLLELRSAIAKNFEGKNAERIRQILINKAPKYGNDDDYVDLLTKDAVSYFAEEVKKYTPWCGGVYSPTLQTISGNVPAGILTGATPDGRKNKEPLADNVSPSPGSDIKGPTAVIRSVTKLNNGQFGCGVILNLKLHPTAVATKEGRRKFAALIKTLFQLKGFQVQFNIVSTAMLRDAQKKPEEYSSLVIKVAGYSAFFSQIDKKLQDQIIERTEHILT